MSPGIAWPPTLLFLPGNGTRKSVTGVTSGPAGGQDELSQGPVAWEEKLAFFPLGRSASPILGPAYSLLLLILSAAAPGQRRLRPVS
jgi:hypothetical protein